MGKKRRLNSSMAKFGRKHANHPRVAILLSADRTPAAILEDRVVEDAPVVSTVEVKDGTDAEVAPDQPLTEIKAEQKVEQKVSTSSKAVHRKKVTKKTSARHSRTKKKATQETTTRK